MSLQAHEWRFYYRQFLRAGHKALGLTGLQTRIYTLSLRRRFRSLPVSTSTTNNAAQYDRELWIPKMQNTLLLVQNASASSIETNGKYPLEKQVLKQMVHFEYGFIKGKQKIEITPSMTVISTPTSATPGTSDTPDTPDTPGKKKKQKTGDIETNMMVQSYIQLIQDLNKSMNMCI